MSLPSFPGGSPSSPHRPPPSHSPTSTSSSSGAGDHLPIWLLALCGVFTAVATGVSIMSITLQLKNYRRPSLQRAVVRIMLMVPLYAISSLIALFSLEAAFFIDAVRDLYEAFVIYTFLQLLITYLGGERSLLIILHGRPPIPHPFPVGLFLRPMDVSDPWVLLNLKRGVLQYVQIKPLLVIATVILKVTGTYQEGRFAGDSGYTYISIVYNTSICLSLYCLAMFWVCVSDDLKPFRPVLGPYTDAEHMSLALVDSLICFEMPFFAQYAFQASDYIDNTLVYAARLPFIYAFRDAFGLKDVWQDTKDTFKGRGVSYQAYEPAEGGLHYGVGRQRRIRAGLRYSKGGTAKYWIPIPGDEARGRGETGPLTAIKRRVDKRLAAREGYAPLLPKQSAAVLHHDPDGMDEENHVEWGGLFDSDSEESDAPSLDFKEDEDDWEDQMYARARRIGYAGFPNVDVSKEEARRRKWEEEDAILRGQSKPENKRKKSGKGKGRSKEGSKANLGVYGAWADRVSQVEGRNGRASPGPGSAGAYGEGAWLFDGTNDTAPEDKRQLLKPENLPRLPGTKRTPEEAHAQNPPMVGGTPSPFALGEDDSSIDSDDSVEASKRPLPADAVDLVIADHQAVEEARSRERRKGEPQNNAPTQVFRKAHDLSLEDKDEVERVYNADGEGRNSLVIGKPMEGVERPDDIVRQMTPPAHAMSSSLASEENPWA
ncbi:organic solute transporter subunit alpha, partial [Tremellales sp. Uapishka_1]